jgi:CubicO group peptidase (beta-lactamase class C family)
MVKVVRVLVPALVVVGVCRPATVAAQGASQDLTGLWSIDTVYNSGARGELTVVHHAAGWKARIAGAEMTFAPSGDSIRFGNADTLGAFRGALASKRQLIDGFWIQPRPVTIGQYYATPLVLHRSGRESWRGTVTPIEDRLTLYLSIQRNPDNTLVAVFRHPQANAFGRGLRYTVTTSGDSVHLVAAANQYRPETRISGTLDAATRALTIKMPELDQPMVLRPQAPETAVNFYPRLPRRAKYVYHPPPRLDDGWEVSRLREAGFDEAALERLVQRIVDSEPTAPRAPLIHSILIARHGKLVLEEYFFGYDRTQAHDTRSLGKTFASVMLGGAMLAGDPIAPESLIAPESADPRKARITLAHVLTHTTGLACDDNDDNSPGNEDVLQNQTAQPDWWRYTLDLSMVYEPGTHYAYCSGGMNLAAYALTRASRTWLPALFDRTVARPLGFGRWYWNLMPTLEGYQGGGMRILPRDLLKVGVAYLSGGVWRGKRIVSREWVERSTVNQVAPGVGKDGYAWHLSTLKVGEREYREYEGNGNGGQLLILVPELDLAVVFTAGNYLDYGVWGRYRDVLVPEMIQALSR